jgi:hypothetical protein
VDELFSATLRPKTCPADRKAIYEQINLSKYAGQEVELMFSTDPVPGVNTKHAWAGWGDIRFTSAFKEEPASCSFREIYNDEVKIFEFPHVLPRATIYYGMDLMDNADDILRRLKDPSFNVWGKALVWKGALPVEDRTRLERLRSRQDRKAVPARIVSYQSQRVVIEASAEEPSLLMLNDADYPGWKAYVNGRRESILNVDYLFRGVMLPRGNCTVEFIYRPFSFLAGAVVSLLAMITGLIFFIFKMRKGGRKIA